MTTIDTTTSKITPTRDMNSLTGSSSVSSDPYTIFNNNIGSMLATLQNTNTKGNAALGGAANTLTNESITGNNQTFNPQVFSDSQVQNQQNLQNAFTPAISSLNTQIENNNATVQGINTYAGTMLGQMKGQFTATLNPSTGKMDSFNSNTGVWASTGTTDPDATSAQKNTEASNPSIINGVDYSGASTGRKPYATDPEYSKIMQSQVGILQSQMPNGYDPVIADTILKAHKSPLTSNMISAASSAYGIDPINLMAQLSHESGYGTSNVAVEDNNPMGIMWTSNLTNAVQGTPRRASEGGFYAKFDKISDGLYAGAKIASAYVPGNPNADTPTPDSSKITTPIGGQFSDVATQKVAQLPPAMQPYVDAGAQGVAYINDTKVPNSLKDILQMQAAKTGIPYLDGNESANIKGIGLVYSSAKQLSDLASSTLGSGIMGRIAGLTLNPTLAFSQILTGPQLKQFDQYRAQAINNLKALTAGGTTFRITQTEIDTAVGNIPSSEDNIETATTDLATLQKFMDDKLASTFPYIQGSQPGASGAQNSSGTGIDAIKSKYKINY